MPNLLPAFAALALFAPARGPAPLAIVSPENGALVRGAVHVVASEEDLVDWVRLDWSTNGFTWTPIGPDLSPQSPLEATWDTGGYMGAAIVRATDSGGNQTHIRVTVDNTAPDVGIVAPRAFSPNGDGRNDRAVVRVAVSEPAELTLQMLGPRGRVVQTEVGDQASAKRMRRIGWDGEIFDGLKRAPDGLYSIRAIVRDRAGNETTAASAIRVDTHAPRVHVVAASPAVTSSPRVALRVALGDADPEGVSVRSEIFDSTGDLVRRLPTVASAPRGKRLTVLLRANDGSLLPPGAYRIGVSATDEAGNGSDAAAAEARILFSHAVRAHVWGRFEGVGRRVALTFDDCYDGYGWAGVLDALARADVRATFFCTGQAVLANPRLAVRTVAAGHAIGSHGWDHADFARLSFDSSYERLLEDRDVWWRLARVAPTPLFRPPYGAYTPTTVSAAGAAGYEAVVLWDVDPYDWQRPGVATIVQRVVGPARPGGILLMHTLPETAAALPTILDELRARGYGFMTVPQLAALGTPTPGHWSAY